MHLASSTARNMFDGQLSRHASEELGRGYRTSVRSDTMFR